MGVANCGRGFDMYAITLLKNVNGYGNREQKSPGHCYWIYRDILLLSTILRLQAVRYAFHRESQSLTRSIVTLSIDTDSPNYSFGVRTVVTVAGKVGYLISCVFVKVTQVVQLDFYRLNYSYYTVIATGRRIAQH